MKNIRSAAAGTAGSARAPTPAANGTRRLNAESGTETVVDKIDLYVSTRIQKVAVHQKRNSPLVKNVIVVLLLIQSQSQRGTSSSSLHQGDTDCRIDFILLHVCLEIGNSQLRCFKHGKSSINRLNQYHHRILIGSSGGGLP